MPVPDVRSRPLKEAVQALGQAGFDNLEIRHLQTADMPPDVVVEQFPRADTVPVSTEIVLVVAEPGPGEPVAP